MKIKKEFKYFSIVDHEKEQEYLRAKNKAGWKFVKVSGLGIFHFVQCEPEDVVYQLDYNQDGLEHKDEYVQMFKDCGWEYIQDYAGYSYFRKSAREMNGDEEIFCDDASRLQMMERVYKGRVLPLVSLFFCILVPQLILSLTVYDNVVLAIIYAVIIAIYLAMFGVFAAKFNSYKKKVNK